MKMFATIVAMLLISTSTVYARGSHGGGHHSSSGGHDGSGSHYSHGYVNSHGHYVAGGYRHYPRKKKH
jgi:hypothetical protein